MTGWTHDKTGVEPPPRLEDEFSRTGGRKLFDKLAQGQVYLSSGDARFNTLPVLGRVCVIQQVTLSVYNRDLLVLKADLSGGARRSVTGDAPDTHL